MRRKLDDVILKTFGRRNIEMRRVQKRQLRKDDIGFQFEKSLCVACVDHEDGVMAVAVGGGDGVHIRSVVFHNDLLSKLIEFVEGFEWIIGLRRLLGGEVEQAAVGTGRKGVVIIGDVDGAILHFAECFRNKRGTRHFLHEIELIGGAVDAVPFIENANRVMESGGIQLLADVVCMEDDFVGIGRVKMP